MIKGIIFDGGNTLFRPTADLNAAIREGAHEMATWYLKKKHVKLNSEDLIETYLTEREVAHRQAQETQMEVLAQDCLRAALKKIEAPASATALIEAAVKIAFEREEAIWQPYPDAVDTLQQLQAAGYRLGLLSNASDDKLIQRLINKCKLRPWLSPTFSSAGLGWRKPRPEGFLLIADRWGLRPAEIVMVGDTLAADILGAHNAGMRSILATMDESPTNEAQRHIEPTGTISTLSELPNLVAQL